jgi:HD-GYP domain-containing protein (c-di-GMP phosphodiesterase class II)
LTPKKWTDDVSKDDEHDSETRISFGRDPGGFTVANAGGTIAAAMVDVMDPVLLACCALLPARDLKDAAERLAPALIELDRLVSRVALFSVDAAKGLLPLASRERPGVRAPYCISKEMLRQCVKERRPQTRRMETSTGSRHVAVIPLLEGGLAPLAMHVELDAADPAQAAAFFTRLQGAARLFEPKLEALALNARLDRWVSGMVTTINAAIEAKDTYTSGHSQRVARYSHAIGIALRLGTTQMDALLFSALCHDIGKIGVPDEILKKPGMLSSEEFGEMKAHPLIGARIMQDSPNAAEIMAGVRSHHERFDGTGYPDGLEGDKIPLFARIIAIADAFDAMTSGRSYSGYMSAEEAVATLREKSELFDLDVLRAFGKAMETGSLSMRTGTQIGVISA